MVWVTKIFPSVGCKARSRNAPPKFTNMVRQYRSVKPPSPQIWGSKIYTSPPGLGDLGGGRNNLTD